MEKHRLNKKQLSALHTQQKIKNTVVQLLCDKDFEQVTIREICRLADVSIGTFYLYFQSKEAALLYSHRYIEDIFGRFEFGAVSCPIERVCLIAERYIRSIREENFNYIQQIYISHIKCYDSDMFTPQRVLASLLSSTLERGQQEGVIKNETPPDALAQHIMLVCRGYIYDYCINPARVNMPDWYEKTCAYMRWHINYMLKSSIADAGAEFTAF